MLLEALRTQGDVEGARNLHGEFERVTAQLGPTGTAVRQVIIAAMSYDQENFEDAAARLAVAHPFIALLVIAPSLQTMHVLLDCACDAALVTSPGG